jgi:hypothetical protein
LRGERGGREEVWRMVGYHVKRVWIWKVGTGFGGMGIGVVAFRRLWMEFHYELIMMLRWT